MICHLISIFKMFFFIKGPPYLLVFRLRYCLRVHNDEHKKTLKNFKAKKKFDKLINKCYIQKIVVEEKN